MVFLSASQQVDAQNNSTTAMANVDNSTAPATANGSTPVTDASSGSVGNSTATGAGFAPQSTALSLILPVSIVGVLLHGRC